MSNDEIKQYVVSFRYQEKGLSDLLQLGSILASAGFTTTLNDARANRMSWEATALVSSVPCLKTRCVSWPGLREKGLGILPEVDVEIWQPHTPSHLNLDKS